MNDPFSDSLVRGARLFDRASFFEAHEAWEDLWRTEPDPSKRRLLQGLIQIAAAFHKLLVMKSPPSAARLLARGLAKLDACPDTLVTWNLAAFRDALRVCERMIGGATFDRSTIPRIASPAE